MDTCSVRGDTVSQTNVLSFARICVVFCPNKCHVSARIGGSTAPPDPPSRTPMLEDTSSLPVPETKFKGSEGERLGQLVVTPEVVASKINNMKENKSPGVDGISPKILKETVEQISTPLADNHVLHVTSGGNCTFRMEGSKHGSLVQKRCKKQVCKL